MSGETQSLLGSQAFVDPGVVVPTCSLYLNRSTVSSLELRTANLGLGNKDKGDAESLHNPVLPAKPVCGRAVDSRLSAGALKALDSRVRSPEISVHKVLAWSKRFAVGSKYCANARLRCTITADRRSPRSWGSLQPRIFRLAGPISRWAKRAPACSLPVFHYCFLAPHGARSWTCRGKQVLLRLTLRALGLQYAEILGSGLA